MAVVSGAPAAAQAVKLTPLQDARLRYEHVDQDGIARAADAVTMRVRSGVAAAVGGFSALVEAQGSLAILDRYDDNVSGPSRYAAVGDPQNVALYRAQLQYRTKGLALTAGRQRLSLDDERFVGPANFRQNGRTFDAVRVEYAAVPKLKADLTYAWSVRTPSGINGTGAKPTSIGGDNLLANLAYATPLGTVTGFAYLVDQDAAAVQNYRLSSQSYGARFVGGHAFGVARLGWTLSYATQSDYARNPNRYRADYYLADATADIGAAKLGLGYEVLGADKGAALTSFQTPLSSIFRFQGWADKFTTTPPNGVQDLYASAGWSWKQVGPLKAVSFGGVYHHFDSERLSLHYGHEFDLLAQAKWHRYLMSVRYAEYHADRFATDTRKLWLQLDFTL